MKIKADEYYQKGPLEVARFGKFVHLRNNMTSSEHDEFIENAATHLPDVIAEIDSEILELINLIKNYNPEDLLKVAYSQFVIFHADVEKESELDRKQIQSFWTLEYIQNLIASLNFYGPFKLLEKEDMEEIHNRISKIYNSILGTYFLCQSAVTKKETPSLSPELESFKVRAQQFWCSVRGARYSFHHLQHFQELLSPHEDKVKEEFGLTILDIIKGIGKIQNSLEMGLINSINKLKEEHKRFCEKAESLSEEELSNTTIEELIADLSSEEERNALGENLYGLGLFDVAELTGWSERFINSLTWKIGENTDFLQAGEFSGWPLKVTPIMRRPFIQLNDKSYCFNLVTFLDKFYRVLQCLLVNLDPSYSEIWNRKQKELSESLPIDYLKMIAPNSTVLTEVYYEFATDSTGRLKWCENDAILTFDDFLLIIEIKAGTFTADSPATNFDRYLRSVDRLLFKPSSQGKRFFDYLNSAEEVPIYNKKHQLIKTLKKGDFKEIMRVVVTLDQLTELAAQIQYLPNSQGIKEDIPIWAISIDDLRVFKDIFTSQIEFFHFLEMRAKAFYCHRLKLDDELDHIGLYFKYNDYALYANEFNHTDKIVWGGYRDDIDKFFFQKRLGSVEKFSEKQNLPEPLGQIIEILSSHPKKGSRFVGASLLNYDNKTREEMAANIQGALIRQAEKRRLIPVSTSGEVPITFVVSSISDFKHKKSDAKKAALGTLFTTSDKFRILIEVLFCDSGEVFEVDHSVFYAGNLTDEEIEIGKSFSERIKQSRKKQFKSEDRWISRNAKCPCGSGKKYKKCCLDR